MKLNSLPKQHQVLLKEGVGTMFATLALSLSRYSRYAKQKTNHLDLSIGLYDNLSMDFFGAAFELGRHDWFALRRLITNSRSPAFTGSFLKETSQEDGRNKNWTMQRLLHRSLRLRKFPTGEQIQSSRTADEIPRDPITPWCGPPLFCPCFSLAETSVLKIS